MLITRIRALLRRAGLEAAIPQAITGLRLDATDLTLHIGDEVQIRLTRLEYSLLQLLFAHPGDTVHADRMLAHVWGRRGGGDRHVLKQLVHRLRHKVGEASDLGSFIENVPGVGYRLRPERLSVAG
jgi:DNA-binding response OmpR family regulator